MADSLLVSVLAAMDPAVVDLLDFPAALEVSRYLVGIVG